MSLDCLLNLKIWWYLKRNTWDGDRDESSREEQETPWGERLCDCILIFRWLWRAEKYEMAPCSCYKYPAACKLEDGYIQEPAANFSKYSFSAFPVYSFLNIRLCSAAERGSHSWAESRAVWAAGCGCGYVELGEQSRDAIGPCSAVLAAFLTSPCLYSCVWGTALPLAHPKCPQESAEEQSFLLLLFLSREYILVWQLLSSGLFTSCAGPSISETFLFIPFLHFC